MAGEKKAVKKKVVKKKPTLKGEVRKKLGFLDGKKSKYDKAGGF